MEKGCNGKWKTNILLNVAGDKNQTPTDEYKRQRRRNVVMTKLFSQSNVYIDILR